MPTFRRVVLDISDLRKTVKTIKKFRSAQARLSTMELQLNTVRKKIRSKYIVPMMRYLSEYPQRRQYPEDYPIEWTSERQRKYVMGYVLKGKPYQRTGKLGNSWKYRIRIKDNNRIVVEIENDSPYYKWVVGNYGTGTSPRSMKRYLVPMQRFHTITGWQPASKYTTKYINRAKREGQEMLQKWADSLFK